ncbi:hypothetical protein ACFL6M_04380 [Candidatus Eisenbacteria bacterium]|uniref:Uncharacterized protein n=1 Tax=Eiseniibacteriota bacterium TaxID=2212470 RepID=A0ABV6YKF7_UNCEI
MRARRVFSDKKEQDQHAWNFQALRKLRFRTRGKELVEKELQSHPGREIATAIQDVYAKADLFEEDFVTLNETVEVFWAGAFRRGTRHAKYCSLQRAVWRAAFHATTSAQSLSETIASTMKHFSTRRKVRGKKDRKFYADGFVDAFREILGSPINNFGHSLRGWLYHVKLSNPDWVGYKTFDTGEHVDRFLLDYDTLMALAKRRPLARPYILENSITVRGSHHQRSGQPFGVDLVAHFVRHRRLLKRLAKLVLQELRDPHFGQSYGFAHHSLEEYLDWERAGLGTSREWKRCKHCGHWFPGTR